MPLDAQRVFGVVSGVKEGAFLEREQLPGRFPSGGSFNCCRRREACAQAQKVGVTPRAARCGGQPAAAEQEKRKGSALCGGAGQKETSCCVLWVRKPSAAGLSVLGVAQTIPPLHRPPANG